MKVGKKTALLCVDLQKNLTLEGGGNYYPTAAEMMPRVIENIQRFRELGAHIIYIWTKMHPSSGLTCAGPAVNPELAGRHVPRPAWGMELDDRLTIDPEDDVLCKFTYSAFWGTPLVERLQQKGVENVLVCGIKTNVCCRQTAIDSTSHGFKTYVIQDMTCTNNREIKDYHLAEMDKYFAKVIDSGEVIRRLGSGEF